MKSLREALRRFTYLSAVLAVCLVFVSAGVADEAGVDTRHRSGQGDKDRHGNKDNKVDFWLTILHNNKWAVLEVKRSKADTSPNRLQPHQGDYIRQLDAMSYASFVYPENVEEVLRELQRAL